MKRVDVKATKKAKKSTRKAEKLCKPGWRKRKQFNFY